MVTKGPGGIDIMDSARDNLLARAGFAQQQRRPTASAQLLNQIQHLAGPGRLADENILGFVHIGRALFELASKTSVLSKYKLYDRFETSSMPP